MSTGDSRRGQEGGRMNKTCIFFSTKLRCGARSGRAGARKGLTDRGKTETVLKSDTKKEGGN